MLMKAEKGLDFFHPAADVLVNPVNVEGIAGAGLAKEFSRRYPADIERYRQWCKHPGMTPGECFVTMEGKRCIAHVATKRSPFRPSEVEWIRLGLDNLVADVAGLLQLRSIQRPIVHVPALGCGHGKLPWPLVRDMMVHAFIADPDICYVVFPPPSSLSLVAPPAPQPNKLATVPS